METRLRTAQERRQDITDAAAEMGIDEDYISRLVDGFYQRVRNHPALGPIFAEKIDDWEPHLATMKDFWASVALNAGRYSGKPMPKHLALTSVEPHHFDIWLGLFRAELEDSAPSPQAVTYFMVRAERIADSLKLAMFGAYGFGKPTAPKAG